MSRDGSVGIATRYGLDGPVAKRFSAPVQTGPVAHSSFCTIGHPVSSLRVKQRGHDIDHPRQSRAEVK
jgi:hypothetical protein